MPTPNQTVRLEVATARSSDGGTVEVRVIDDASGTILTTTQIPPADWWLLITGGTHTTPAFVSPHLDRIGKRMENMRVTIPTPLEDDTDRDTARDVHKAVIEQLPEDWHYAWDEHDKPRQTNRQTWYTIVRRWVTP